MYATRFVHHFRNQSSSNIITLKLSKMFIIFTPSIKQIHLKLKWFKSDDLKCKPQPFNGITVGYFTIDRNNYSFTPKEVQNTTIIYDYMNYCQNVQSRCHDIKVS